MSKPEPNGAADQGRLDALVAGARERAKAEQARFAALLDKHDDRPLVDVALRTYRRDREIAGTVVGSALALRLFLFFVPLFVFVVGLAGSSPAGSTPTTSPTTPASAAASPNRSARRSTNPAARGGPPCCSGWSASCRPAAL